MSRFLTNGAFSAEIIKPTAHTSSLTNVLYYIILYYIILY